MRLSTPFSLVLSFVLFAASSAHADSPDPTRKEAADRFDRGIHMVDAGDLSGGLAEFQRAYALVPAPVVIYNVGLVYAAMNRPVDAVRALEKALQNQEALKPDVAARARDVLREQGEKIGQLQVAANVKEGVIEIDNVEIAKLPLAGPLDVAAGSHVVGVISRGYAPGRKEVLVIPKTRAEVAIEVVPIEGLLGHIEVRSRIPGADVFVDGGRVGKTPLESSVTVAPGAHMVEIKRAGYTPVQRSVTLQDGARSELSIDPSIDRAALAREGGLLSIKTSEDQAIVSADGEDLGLLKGALELPAGPHRIRVERGGFIPAERDLDVPLGATKTISVVFEPTPDTRAAYVSSATSRRTWSWVTIGAGALLAGAGVIVAAVVEPDQLTSDQRVLDAVNADAVRRSGRVCDPAADQNVAPPGGMPGQLPQYCTSRLSSAQSNVDNDKTFQTLGWVATGVGGAVVVTGIILLVTGDSPHKYDEKASQTLVGGWRVTPAMGIGGGSLSVSGEF